MSAEILRRAAALMRERAEAATPGPWSQHTAEAAADTVIFAGRDWITNVDNCPSVGEHMRTAGGSICSDQAIPNGTHIASWHPAVALLAAEVLEDHAWEHDCYECGWAEPCAPLRLARAYLGADQ